MVGQLEKLIGETTERFSGVAAQFSERDTRTDQRAGDTKLAVDAAFAAAKEATSKIELGFTKQIDSMVLAMDTLSKNLDSKINDVKDMINDAKARLTALSYAPLPRRIFQVDLRNYRRHSRRRVRHCSCPAALALVLSTGSRACFADDDGTY